MDSDQWPGDASGIDLGKPNSARMYDYYLGGSANFAIDREAAEAGLTAMPHARDYARANRAFLGRAVAHLARNGIDQFLDLGSGVPTVGNVHEIAQSIEPSARVAYVDHEAVAVAHARRLLDSTTAVTVTNADIRVPSEVLAAPGVADLIDFSRPVAVLAVAIIPFIPDQREANEVLDEYRQATTSGSALVLSHISALSATPLQVADAEEVMASTPTPARWRTREEIEDLVRADELIEPGLVPVPLWRPDRPLSADTADSSNALGAVGWLQG